MSLKLEGGLFKKIREQRNETLEQFGIRLGISATALWKIENGESGPHKLTWMALAALCSGDERQYCIRKSAGSVERLLPLLDGIQAERKARPSENEIARIPGITHTRAGGVQEEPSLRVIPSELVREAGTLRYFVIDGPGQMGNLKPGDVVILDRSEDIAANLEPLIMKQVLVKWFQPPDVEDKDWPVADAEYEGYYLGLLRVKEDMVGRPKWNPKLAEWVITVEPYDKHGPNFDPANYHDRCIGEMTITARDWKRIGYAADPKELYTKELEVSRLRHKLFPGIEILGEVVGWFRPAPKAQK